MPCHQIHSLKVDQKKPITSAMNAFAQPKLILFCQLNPADENGEQTVYSQFEWSLLPESYQYFSDKRPTQKHEADDPATYRATKYGK